MVEVLNQIQTAESQAEEIRRTARHQTKQQMDDAVATAKQKAEANVQKAAAEAAGIVQGAESEAAAHLADFGAQSQTICDDMVVKSKAKMEKAAAFIVERIVQSL